MTLSTFSFPTTILFGPGAINQLPEELARRGMRNPLIVTDRGLAGAPVFARIRSFLPQDAPVFTDVDPNPTEQNVLNGVQAYCQASCDSVVAIGGGSPIDAGKAIRFKVTHGLDLEQYDDLVDGGNKITDDIPPFIAIPTTAGTGSEVGRATVITIARTNRKTVIFAPKLIPSLALDDPELTVDMPPHITAGTGMDAFTHNVEAYLAKGYHPICDAIALRGAKLASENLPRVIENPKDIEARGNMMMASMMGAIAFQKGLGATHSLAHPLSSEFGMHHGTTNAVLLPVVLEFNSEVSRDRLRDLFGSADPAEHVRSLNRRIGIALRLRDHGIPEDSLEALADKAIQDGCHQLNPRPCSRNDLLDLYRRAW
jgi:4-hydroxybutyrate dehydrogenase